MSELGQEARDLLEGARHGFDPTDADRARVRAGLDARIAAGAGPASVPNPRTGTLARLGVGAASVGVAALLLGGALTWRPWARPTPSGAELSPAPVVAPVTPVAPGPAGDRAQQAAPTLELPNEVPTVSVDSLPGAAPAPKPVLRVPSKPTAAGGSLEAEVALVREAQAALAAGDSAKALGALDEHARRFPSGIMTEERQATRVLALCAAGRTGDARAAGKAFLDAHPASPAAQRVRASCGGT